MSIHELLRELWDADDGEGLVELAKAGFVFAFGIAVILAWAVVLSAMLS